MNKWLIPALVSLVLSIGGWTYASLDARVAKIEDQVPSKAVQVATLEAQTKSLKEQLDRLEAKVDFLIRYETGRKK